jgi:hypothetical protein
MVMIYELQKQDAVGKRVKICLNNKYKWMRSYMFHFTSRDFGFRSEREQFNYGNRWQDVV